MRTRFRRFPPALFLSVLILLLPAVQKAAAQETVPGESPAKEIQPPNGADSQTRTNPETDRILDDALSAAEREE